MDDLLQKYNDFMRLNNCRAEYLLSNGQTIDFVYKEENGRLVKQPVKTGKIFYGMVEIKSGITEEDFIAFPYGKKVKEGASVKEISAEDAYNMYGGLG